MTNMHQARSAEVEFVLPAYNEQAALAVAVRLLSRWLRLNATYSWQITIVDNGSTDSTLAIATRLAAGNRDCVRVVHLDEKGRGNAVRHIWGSSSASVVAYMDVDLSTDVSSTNRIIDPLLNGKADVAFGSRLAPGAHVVRSLKNGLVSRVYNGLLRHEFGYDVSDAQCGFKAMTTRAARTLLPSVRDDGWFFDSELLVLAYAAGLELVEVPVSWKENFESAVNVPQTISQNLAGIRRVRDELAHGNLPLDAIYASSCKVAVPEPERELAPVIMMPSVAQANATQGHSGVQRRRAAVITARTVRPAASLLRDGSMTGV